MRKTWVISGSLPGEAQIPGWNDFVVLQWKVMIWIVWLISSNKETANLVAERDGHSSDVHFIHVIAAERHDLIILLCSKLHAEIDLCCTVVDMLVFMGRFLVPFSGNSCLIYAVVTGSVVGRLFGWKKKLVDIGARYSFLLQSWDGSKEMVPQVIQRHTNRIPNAAATPFLRTPLMLLKKFKRTLRHRRINNKMGLPSTLATLISSN